MQRGPEAFPCQEMPCRRLPAEEKFLKTAFIFNFAKWIQPTVYYMHTHNTALFSVFQSSVEAA